MQIRRTWALPALTLLLALTPGAGTAGCRPAGASLETRTFELHYLRPTEAARIVAPYVYADRPGAPGSISSFKNGLTVRETRDNLERITGVLERYDRPAPNVRLHFQLIEADGPSAPDPRIASLDSLLRGLFRYRGYRLLDEVPMTIADGRTSSTRVRLENRSIGIDVSLDRVRTGPAGGEVDLRVGLTAPGIGRVLETSLTVPLGKTVVLGSGALPSEKGSLIVAVRPELLPSDSAASGG